MMLKNKEKVERMLKKKVERMLTTKLISCSAPAEELQPDLASHPVFLLRSFEKKNLEISFAKNFFFETQCHCVLNSSP